MNDTTREKTFAASYAPDLHAENRTNNVYSGPPYSMTNVPSNVLSSNLATIPAGGY